MFTRSLLSAAACLAVAGAVLAQGSSAPAAAPRAVLGKAINVEGLVTVSDGNGVSRVAVNNPVIAGTRYVTSSSGSATLQMDKGCDIELKPNQALTVEDEQSCGAMLLAIQSLGSPGGAVLAGGAAGTSSAVAPFLVGGAIVLLMGGGGSAPVGQNPGDPGIDPGIPPCQFTNTCISPE